MPRGAASTPLDEIIREAVEPVLARASEAIARAVAAKAAEQLGGGRIAASPRAAGSRPRRSRPRGEMTRWVADNRARRVPNFVIEMTGGLDTKKKIVARYGQGATFEKGKPVPKPR